MDGEKGIKMMGPEYFTVAAYMPEDSGIILCVKCGEHAGLPASDQVTQSEFNGGAWNDGCYCDDCGAEIAAPYTWTCPNCEREYSGEAANEAASVAESEYHGKCCDACAEV